MSLELVVIGVAALATSILSSVAGLGGGVILLVILAQFYAPTVAIPIQGGIQFFANGSRALILWEKISWPAVGWSSILLFPATLLGVAVATALPVDATRFIMGVFVLVIAWRPSLLKWKGDNAIPPKALIGVGAAQGFINATVGASGPVTSPFFKAATASHAAFVATAAATQILAHTSKLAAFSLDGFNLADHSDTIIVGAVSVIAGSWIGTRLLGRTDEAKLAIVFKVVLTALAFRLIIRALI